MTDLLPRLLPGFAAALKDPCDDTRVVAIAAAGLDTPTPALLLEIRAVTDDAPLGRWRITAKGAVRVELRPELASAWASILDQHPLLLPTQQPSESVYISGQPRDPALLIADLHDLNCSLAPELRWQVPPTTDSRFRGSGGRLCVVPESVAEQVAPICERHGLLVSRLRMRRFLDGEFAAGFLVGEFANVRIVAQGFEAERGADAVES